MKSNYWKTLSYITIAFAVMFAVAGMNGKVARADHGSDYDCYLWHDYEKCCGSNTGQNYLNGTTHVFKLQTPDELKDYPVTWTVSGTDIQSKAVQVEFLEKSNTSATVKFTGAHESPFSLGVDINAEINIPEGQGSAFADYWFDVYDEFYYSPTPTYVPLAVGSSQKLTCEVLKFDTTHPKGVTTTLTENLTWENAFPALDTGITVSADGTIKPSSGGMYMVLATLKDASPYVSKQFNVIHLQVLWYQVKKF